ncbi:L-serine ammonia-lyase, iron-sulfur-dependent, subunit alpha [Terrisporobacter mayombei]|nr:L-serine ammonia-lyase, iron-sulfur-dependent, subunit alpha [Terrisporobacter mayombei]
MESLKELYKVGNGPSSSHTMGPQRAAEQFKNKYPEASSYRAHLYGSLAATGEGHLTDYIIKKTLEPKDVEIVWREDVVKEYHPNGMMLEALDENKNVIGDWTIYSVGGGTIAEEGMRNSGANDTYPHSTLEEVITWCEQNNKNFADYVKTYDDKDIMDYLGTIKDAMQKSVEDGLATTEVIPGKLNLQRKARFFHEQYEKNKQLNTLIYSYALAASEQNASGYVIVTAPTCGSAGVIPGILFALKEYEGYTDEQILDALAVAGLIGIVVKRNGSVSGAEVGCQGEVGVACAMAAAAIAFLKGGSLRQIEYAAEIGLEHHLGMTCDPAYGYVQIPCIERNAMGAQRAFDAANYALLTNGEHHVTFDQIVEIMDETGRDMMDKYRETSKGGIAKLFFTC